jgi:hypothetical protein
MHMAKSEVGRIGKGKGKGKERKRDPGRYLRRLCCLHLSKCNRGEADFPFENGEQLEGQRQEGVPPLSVLVSPNVPCRAAMSWIRVQGSGFRVNFPPECPVQS